MFDRFKDLLNSQALTEHSCPMFPQMKHSRKVHEQELIHSYNNLIRVGNTRHIFSDYVSEKKKQNHFLWNN